MAAADKPACSVDENGLYTIPLSVTVRGFANWMPSVDEIIVILGKLGREDIKEFDPIYTKIVGEIRLRWEERSRSGVVLDGGLVRLSVPGFQYEKHWPKIGEVIWNEIYGSPAREAILTDMVREELKGR